MWAVFNKVWVEPTFEPESFLEWWSVNFLDHGAIIANKAHYLAAAKGIERSGAYSFGKAAEQLNPSSDVIDS